MIPVYVADAPPSEHLATMLQACSAILQPERCSAVDTAGSAVARVSWLSRDSVRVTVTLAGRDGHRELRFLLEDPPELRWKAIGLVAGALALEIAPRPSPAERTDPSPPPDSAPAAPDPGIRSSSAAPASATVAMAPRKNAPIAPLHWAAGLGLVVGPGLTGGSWRLGGFLGIRLAASRLAGISASVSATQSPEHDRLSARWVSVGLGPSLEPHLWQRFDLVLRAQLCFEQWTVRFAGSGAGTEHSAHRAYLAPRAIAGLGIMLSARARAMAGVELEASPGQHVLIAGTPAGRNPQLGRALLLGVELGQF